jgi:hypothetical protein
LILRAQGECGSNDGNDKEQSAHMGSLFS